MDERTSLDKEPARNALNSADKAKPSKLNAKVSVPTTAPTVTVSGSATAPTQYTLVDEDHEDVEQATMLRLAVGVMSARTKLSPITDTLPDVADAALFITASRALTTGAAATMLLHHGRNGSPQYEQKNLSQSKCK